MLGLWEVKASALRSNDEVSESLMLALGSWAGSGGKGALSGSELLTRIESSLSLSLSRYLRDG